MVTLKVLTKWNCHCLVNSNLLAFRNYTRQLHVLVTVLWTSCCILQQQVFCSIIKTKWIEWEEGFYSKLQRSGLSQGCWCAIFTEWNQCFNPVQIGCVSLEVDWEDLKREKLEMKIALVRNRLSSHLFLHVIISSFWGDSDYTWHHPDEEQELCDNTASVKRCTKWKVYCLGFIFFPAFFILKCQSLPLPVEVEELNVLYGEQFQQWVLQIFNPCGKNHVIVQDYFFLSPNY